jgi:hypothetical protein
MKKLILSGFIGIALLSACGGNPENGGEEVRGNEQRSDTAMRISNYPNEGDSGDNSRYDNGNNQPLNATNGIRTTEGTREDSIKTGKNPLYKGDNSDTDKKPRK